MYKQTNLYYGRLSRANELPNLRLRRLVGKHYGRGVSYVGAVDHFLRLAGATYERRNTVKDCLKRLDVY